MKTIWLEIQILGAIIFVLGWVATLTFWIMPSYASPYTSEDREVSYAFFILMAIPLGILFLGIAVLAIFEHIIYPIACRLKNTDLDKKQC